MRILPRNGTKSWNSTDGRSPLSSFGAFNSTISLHSVWLFWTLKVNVGRNKTAKSDFHMFKYPSGPSWNGSGLFHYGIYASLKKVLSSPFVAIQPYWGATIDLRWLGPPGNCENWSRVLTKISYASSVQKKALNGSSQPQHHRIRMNLLPTTKL